MFLAQNLRFLRQKMDYSQAQAADKIGIPRTTLGDYERGHTEPDMALLIKIAKAYEVQIEALLTRQMEKLSWDEVSTKNVKILAMTIDQKEKGNIELVRTKAAAGYIENFQDPEFVSELPRLHFPALKGFYRAFEIEGDSMLPMESGSIVICKYVERLNEIKNDEPYIVVSQRDGVVYKRLQLNQEHQAINCISDNIRYPVFQLAYEDVREIWEYHAHLAFTEPKTSFENWNEDRMGDIQKKVTELHKHYIGKSEGK